MFTYFIYVGAVGRGAGRNCSVNINALLWAVAAVNIALDIAVVILPLPQLLKLALSRQKKVQVLAMFSVGLL